MCESSLAFLPAVLSVSCWLTPLPCAGPPLFILAGTIFWSKSASLRALTLTFLIQIVIFPLSPAELSFQLSYLALFGILTLAAPIDDILKDLLIPSALSSPLAASIAAILASAPLLFSTLGSCALPLLPLLCSFPFLFFFLFGAAWFSFFTHHQAFLTSGMLFDAVKPRGGSCALACTIVCLASCGVPPRSQHCRDLCHTSVDHHTVATLSF